MKYKLGEVSIFNPTERIPKGAILKKIAMDKLKPFCRDIPDFSYETFSGGSKFRNNDIIMARITPCLENGKTAMVNVLDYGEIGFGSTEYIVIRAKPNVTDSNYLYYLIISSIVREPAIKSMVGSSGRQRVQTDVVKNIEIDLPPLNEQKQIASILKSIDDKIELNTKINENLERQAQAIFKSWFVDFEPFGGAKPSSWVQALLGDIAKISSGTRPPIKSTEKTEKTNIPILGAASIMGFTNQSNHNDKILVTGRVGTHGVVQRFHTPCWTSDNTLVITSKFYEYVYQILGKIDYGSMNRGSTQPLITQTDMKKISIIIPDKTTLEKFETIVGKLMDKYETNILENEKLSKLRDTLLPKLMSGEIDVSNIKI